MNHPHTPLLRRAARRPAAGLALLAAALLAQPSASAVPLTDVQATVLVAASLVAADGSALGDSSGSADVPTLPFPLTVSADAGTTQAGSFASAFAAAESTGPLTLSLDVGAGAGETATADAVASYSGVFAASGQPMRLTLALDRQSVQDSGTGLSASLAFQILAGDGSVLVADLIDLGALAGAQWYVYGFTSGTPVASVEFQLAAGGTSLDAGSASQQLQLAFDVVNVPAPGTGSAFVLGLGVLAARRVGRALTRLHAGRPELRA